MPATGGAPDQRRDMPGTPLELVPGTRWRRVFPGEERQLGVIRRWLASLLPDSPARDDLAVVATELGTNAIRHTVSGRGGWLVVEIAWYGPVVRVTVGDNGGPTEPRVIDDPAAEHGRGLLLVRGLSLRTGVCGDHRGRLVWADLLWESTDQATQGNGSAVEDDEIELAQLLWIHDDVDSHDLPAGDCEAERAAGRSVGGGPHGAGQSVDECGLCALGAPGEPFGDGSRAADSR